MSLNRSLMAVDLGRGTRRFQRFGTLGGVKPQGEPPRPRGVFDPDLLRAAIPHAFRKLDPRRLVRNPVMFVVEITAVLVTLIAVANATGLQPAGGRPVAFLFYRLLDQHLPQAHWVIFYERIAFQHCALDKWLDAIWCDVIVKNEPSLGYSQTLQHENALP